MAKDETKRLNPKELVKDQSTYAAFLKIEGYKESKPEWSAASFEKLRLNLENATKAHTQAEAALKTARDKETEAEWAFHNAMIDLKNAVTGQFGIDSDERQSLGLKKTSERKSPKRKPKAA